ncbi:MAG: DNA repair protein RecN [Acidimicrobiia bacterium]
MLVELHVVDLGIVADLDLVLGAGLTAITGETGAGKTLLVEALELLVGGRADPSLVRDGAAEARVEGRFVDRDGNETVFTRVIPRDGRSRAYIDGRLATAGELATCGADLVDLHGQHAHQSLLDPAVQRAALDRFAGPEALDALDAYRDARREARDAEQALAALGGDARARAREVDLLRFQVDEIAAAALDAADEDATLEAEEELLADAVAHRDALARAYAALEGPALDAVGAAHAQLEGRAPFAALATRLHAAQAEVADIERELRLASDAISDDPQRLDTVRVRRNLLRELQRKYGDTLGDVITYAHETALRLEELERFEERAAALEATVREAQERATRAAARVTNARTKAAAPLARAIETHLHELAMPHATMDVEIEPADLTEDGADRVTFLLAPNPGEQSRPMARAASGGELSRSMLAVRVVLTAAPPTLVFDEVDAGIGGEAGLAVGRLLKALGARHQVMCVTHLAQVAAFADTQVVVEKVVELAPQQGGDERTISHAAVVAGEDRVAELSRMLAGVGGSAHARNHAEELLHTARAAPEEPNVAPMTKARTNARTKARAK